MLLMASSGTLAQMKDPKAVANEREVIRQQLKQVRQNIEQTTSRQTSTSKELVAVEKSIAESNAQLLRLQKENERLKAEIVAISENQDETEKSIEQQKNRLGKVLRSQHRRSQYNPMHAWLGGQSRQAISRDAYWYEHISSAEVAVGETLQEELDELEALLGAKEERQEQVQRNEDSQQRKKVVLLEQQDTRKQLLGELNKRLESQKQEVSRLERDEKRMTTLIEELAEAIRLAKKRAESERKTAENRSKPSQQRRSEMTFSTVPDNGEFAKLKGRLELPAGGEVTGRFGQTRSSDGSGPAWRGIFLKVGQGAPVKAVSSGKVVFSEWLRGFGQLIILDHGDQFMSIYGNNQRLLKSVGDTVKQGDVIASVGDSSGNLETGLYFELRHQGQPIDPLKWAVTR
jgi:septal ring factor EnvC (AmiA/AmiB activator)